MYRHAKQVERCQCCMYGITLPDAQGAANFFGNDDSAEIIYPVCTLCRDHERAGFIAGIKIGVQLQRELDERMRI